MCVNVYVWNVYVCVFIQVVGEETEFKKGNIYQKKKKKKNSIMFGTVLSSLLNQCLKYQPNPARLASRKLLILDPRFPSLFLFCLLFCFCHLKKPSSEMAAPLKPQLHSQYAFYILGDCDHFRPWQRWSSSVAWWRQCLYLIIKTEREMAILLLIIKSMTLPSKKRKKAVESIKNLCIN